MGVCGIHVENSLVVKNGGLGNDLLHFFSRTFFYAVLCFFHPLVYVCFVCSVLCVFGSVRFGFACVKKKKKF